MDIRRPTPAYVVLDDVSRHAWRRPLRTHNVPWAIMDDRLPSFSIAATVTVTAAAAAAAAPDGHQSVCAPHSPPYPTTSFAFSMSMSEKTK